MRLIDADAFLEEYCKPYPHIYQAMSSAFKHAPAVDAISVEFIQKRIAELDKAIDYEFNELGEYNGWALHAQSALEQLLKAWEAERREE